MKLKVAICIPCYGDTKSKFTQSLSNMLIHFLGCKLTNEAGEEYEKEVEVFMVASSMLTEGRHRLAAEAVLWGADYMLWLDADHVFPADSLARLWSRGKTVIGCNYGRRCIPTAPTAARLHPNEKGEDNKNLVYTSREDAENGLVEEVGHLGFGMVLINMSLFDRLQARSEEKGEKSFLPLFHMEPTPDFTGMIGEDVFFFRKVRDAGVSVWCDHELSWEVGHIGEMIITNAHANVQREDWVAKWRQKRDRFDPDKQSIAA